MAYADLRDFVQRLEAEGELIRITTPVSARLEITEITDRVSKGPDAHNKALLFENVEGSSIPVLINAFGSARRMALALGVDDLEDVRHKLGKLIDLRLPAGMGGMISRGTDLLGAVRSMGFGPKLVKQAPCQEVVITEDPSLDMLPILTCWPHDGGPYITLPQVITRDPVSGTRNVGMYRLQKFDGQTLAMHWQRHKGGAEHEREAREAQKPRISVAIALGGDPAQSWCGSAPLPPNIDEYLLAAWLRGRPVPFVKCVTQDLEVPANAEIVIEGYLDPNEHRIEGPFGDHTGFYTPEDLFPVMHVTAITHRENPIYPTTIVGKPPMEDYWMGKATERLFLPLMQLFMGEIRDVNMPAEGVFHNLVIVSMKPRFPGHAQKIMYGLWGLGLMMLSKGFVIVDEDVDVHDLHAVADAVFQNVDWPRDVTIVDGPVDQLDHSAVRNSYGGKIGVDATRKPERHPGGQSVPVWATGDITEIVGENWTTYGDAVLVAAVDQATHPAGETIRALWQHIPNHVVVLLDADADVCDLRAVAWRALGNTDWRRDVVFSRAPDHFAPEDVPRGAIGIDARAKGPEDGHPRGWPEEIVMDNQIVQRVTEKWDSYGIGA
ncbi:menaquinone biosynthesis decarboxylase [Aggregatilinea lenta]|uniref:menaquinone biosynthesis decarboxylase n=1 Tax=Aggregatilinea lenta TaxID=913108 RepID=UPI000E5AC75D|nr:menaquinone biosynthesis decarboxylase [Aggregatilinea lenta]